MIGLLQRVSEARVSVGGEEVARIGQELLILVGVQRGDGGQVRRLAGNSSRTASSRRAGPHESLDQEASASSSSYRNSRCADTTVATGRVSRPPRRRNGPPPCSRH